MAKRKSKRLAARRPDDREAERSTGEAASDQSKENEAPSPSPSPCSSPVAVSAAAAVADLPLLEDVADETLPPPPPLVLPETEPVPCFQQIDSSSYLFDRRKCRLRKEVRRMVCDCILTKEDRLRGVTGCGEDCLNRMLMMECGPRCTLGDRCTNQRFQKRQYARVEPFRAGLKGWGLRALQRVPA